MTSTTRNVAEDYNVGSMEPSNILKLLDCPVCLEVPQPPIIMCQQGHNVCQTCRLKLAKCPLCQSNFTQARNLLAEQIVQQLQRKCKFSKDGCFEMIAPQNWSSHLMECPFRQVDCELLQGKQCVLTKCNYRNYFGHLQTVHGVQGVKGTVLNVTQFVTFEQSRLVTNMSRNVWPVQYMDACNEIFLTGVAAVPGKIFWWIYVIGSDEVASKYLAKVTLTLKSKGYESSWTGPVHSFRTSAEAVLEKGLCLLATAETLYPYTFVKMSANVGEENKSEEKTEPNIGWNITYSVMKREKLTGIKSAASPPSRPTLQLAANERLAANFQGMKLESVSPPCKQHRVKDEDEGKAIPSSSSGSSCSPIRIKEEAVTPICQRIKSEILSPVVPIDQLELSSLRPPSRRQRKKNQIAKGKSMTNLSG